MEIEQLIISQLIVNPKYSRKVLPYLKSEYFQSKTDVELFNKCKLYWDEYNDCPSKESLLIEVDKATNISDVEYTNIVETIQNSDETKQNVKWLVTQTEEWAQEQAIYNAIMHSLKIIDGEDDKLNNHAIPDLLTKALGVSFNTQVGHDYIDGAEARYEAYSDEEERVPFDIDILNKITNGGVPKGTLNILLGATNIGKTLSMVSLATSYLKQGLDVLYISMEMSELEIARRIDASMFNVKINEVQNIEKDKYLKGISSIKAKTRGKLKVVQFPTCGAHVGHFKNLLQELELKQNYKPQVILVDYLGICASSRVQAGTTPHILVKSIAEELRGLAVEHDVPVWSAHQLNRNGYENNDADLGDVADSFALASICDFILVLIRTEELDATGKILVKQVKSRYGNKNENEKFVLGVDVDRQRLWDTNKKKANVPTKVKSNRRTRRLNFD